MWLKPGDPHWEIFIFLLYFNFSQEAKQNLFTHNTFQHWADTACRWKVFCLPLLISLGSAGIIYFSGIWNFLIALVPTVLRVISLWTNLLILCLMFFPPIWISEWTRLLRNKIYSSNGGVKALKLHTYIPIFYSKKTLPWAPCISFACNSYGTQGIHCLECPIGERGVAVTKVLLFTCSK